MPNESVDTFLSNLKQLGLISDQELSSCTEELREPGSQSAEDLARMLVERKLLTQYQADRLLQGHPEDCVLAGRYHLLEQIGTGGMGQVFKARDTVENRIVAIKMMALHRMDDPEAVARFKREAQALAQFALPNVVKAFDSGEDRGRNFLVMEYVQGIPLNQLLREKGKIPPTIAADYAYQTAITMERAHKRGLIHRDLKPGNLLLSPDGQIKILDLGLVRFLEDHIGDTDITRDDVGLGTPDYMPPEQFSSARRVDHRADIYALGCTLYQLIAGVVPFPGSSFSEKAKAHEDKEPPPLEERCPQIPAGLTVAVERMMAKRPSDRFQCMGELAEALAPYVAGSSPSLPNVKRTVTWSADRLRMTRRRKSLLVKIGAGLGVLALVLLVAYAGWGAFGSWIPKGEDHVAQNDKVVKDDDATPKEQEPAAVPPKKITIVDGLTVAKGGNGDCTTINEALAKIKPGQRIQVVDDGVYEEVILINDSEKHRDITLEASEGAAIRMNPGRQFALKIDGVSGVKLNKLRFQSENHPVNAAKNEPVFCIQIMGKSHGTQLKELEIKCADHVSGIIVFNTPGDSSTSPIIINNCKISTGGYGLYVSGGPNIPAANIQLTDNDIDATKGITLELNVQGILVAGNLVRNGRMANFELTNLLPTTKDVVITNNTFFGGATSLRIWKSRDYSVLPKQSITIQNNVLMGAAFADLVYVESFPTGGGQVLDSQFLLDQWQFGDNWRDQAGKAHLKITPLAKDDHQLDNKTFVSLSANDHNFLRPAKESPLAASGAGKTHPAFPIYAGAVPPEDAEQWDWQWTWDAFFHKTLTVSQDAKDGGRFRTMNAALKSVKPGMTVRILDDGVYEESLKLDRKDQYAGITIESEGRAVLAPKLPFGVLVVNTPDVTLRRLHLRGWTSNQLQYLVLIVFRSSGARFDELTFEGNGLLVRGIGIERLDLNDSDTPVIIQNCEFRDMQTAVRISGTDDTLQAGFRTGQVIVQNNRIIGGNHGMTLTGVVHNCQIVGNTFGTIKAPAILLGAMFPGFENILIANNTFYDCMLAFEVVEQEVKGKNIRFQNNLVLSPVLDADLTFLKGSILEANPTQAHDGDLLHQSNPSSG